ncbi:serine/threonine protein phosphatase 2A 55 kDa regulatory subunit B alpha isoform-like isoform X2 [Oryza glaberrima]|uniref:serine/threonine protein phosphatase 2A 55 kDa regulatory subunit B alpha isoform-like isoform X2 n=1 Tax=Oryza glaberrima TaxID=4538 RepID=UPI00224C3AB4|nr:serine/threonine protein phosphatase 2A 55 kDa regulatory subunit B alpha isoform-like isoform X2 [Oryza glaberrima]
MSNTGRRRRSLTSIAPSPVSSSPFPSGAREAQAPPSQLPSWKFSQVLGELPLAAAAGEGHDNGTLQDDGDTISAIEFDGRGEHLAASDHAGRVILFRRIDDESHEQPPPPESRAELERTDYAAAAPPAYAYMAEFQSHEQEFDVLHNLEICEKVKKLRWCARPNRSSLCMLATNDRTVKLWKVSEHRSRKGNGQPRRRRSTPTPASLSEIALLGEGDSSVRNGYYYEWASKKARNYLSPDSAEHSEKAGEVGEGYSAKCRRVFSRAHVYNINSISNNCDGETFVSVDDLRINLWHLEVTDQCFNIVDMKPADMEDLVEVITSAEFHPSSCSLLAFGSSRGFVRLVDLRQSALCDRNVRIFQDRGNSVQPRTLFTEIISCISDVKFTGDGKYLLTRDYMNLKLWDLRVESSPVATYKVHEFLRPKLSELYNNDCIFDRFSCCSSKGGDYFATGSYSNTFKVFSRAAANPNGTTLEASTNPYRIQSFPSAKSQGLLSNFARGIQRKGQDGPRSDGREDTKCNMTSKVTHLAWHPMENFIVCAANNSLYMYHT